MDADTDRPAEGAATGDRVGVSDIPGAAPTPESSFHTAAKHLAELREYLGHYLAAKADGWKITLHHAVWSVVVLVAALVVAMAFLAASVVLLLVGAAGGLGVLFGGRPWLGALVVGVAVLGGMVAAVIPAMKWITRQSRGKLVQKYETRKSQQRRRYGQDVETRAGGIGGGVNDV